MGSVKPNAELYSDNRKYNFDFNQLQLVSLIYLKGTYGINIVQFGDAALAILNMYCTMYCT